MAITDGYASSGGDLLAQALKSLGVATVVGTRTWGGVIGCDVRYLLVDGTLVAQPKYAGWFADAGWGVANHGAEPDVEVTIAPHDWAAGRDPQLDAAVSLATEAQEQHPPAVPPAVRTDPPGPEPPPTLGQRTGEGAGAAAGPLPFACRRPHGHTGSTGRCRWRTERSAGNGGSR
ncbi:S41 family peptidase [Actinacidiphila rubida]|uniref:S41 family peptidase n=1 Tax=Actinacidiphila rubida TaxID=310780 RepID=UPI000849B800|nr:S41 family peptidase [Actinacidiphila rubida]